MCVCDCACLCVCVLVRVYAYMIVRVCVCVCVWDREREILRLKLRFKKSRSVLLLIWYHAVVVVVVLLLLLLMLLTLRRSTIWLCYDSIVLIAICLLSLWSFINDVTNFFHPCLEIILWHKRIIWSILVKMINYILINYWKQRYLWFMILSVLFKPWVKLKIAWIISGSVIQLSVL